MRFTVRLLGVVSFALVLVVGLLCAGEVGAVTLDYRLVHEETISEGVIMYHYDLRIGTDVLPARKLVVDTANPFVAIRAIRPEEGFNAKQTVRQLAATRGAVAAVNADFFHLNRPAAPFGLHVEEGEILSSPGDSSTMGFGIGLDNALQILGWRFEGEVVVGGRWHHSLQGYNQTYRAGEHIFIYDRVWGREISSAFFNEPVLQVTVRNGIVTRMEMSAESASIPRDGYVVIAGGGGADFLQQYTRLRSWFDYTLQLEPDTELQTAVGGQALLVDNGRPADPDRLNSPGSTRASRTAVGVSGDQAIFVTVDATPLRAGVTMGELAVFMSRMGAERALNLDGGGSTTMVARRLGEFNLDVVSRPRHGFERAVPNAIGVFNEAPRTDTARLFLGGPRAVLIGAQASYEVSGHDRYYHPVRIDPEQLEWETSDPSVADVVDGVLRARQSGEITLHVGFQGVTEERQVRVIGGDDLASISVIPEEVRLLPGQSVSLGARVTTTDGLSLAAGPETLRWEADLGTVDGNTYRAIDEGFGTLIGFIGDRVIEVPIRVGGISSPFFTFREWQTTTFRSHPAGLPGSFDVQTDPAFVHSGERSGRLQYSFDNSGDGVMIAYGQLGSGQISMGVNNVGISAHVYGDGSGLWLRAEMIDAGGTRRYVDLATALDWVGWQRVTGNIHPDWSQPLVLSSIYVVQEPRHRAAGLPDEGTIYIDNVQMIKGLTEEDQDRALSPRLKMWVNSTRYEVDGGMATMDAAPFIEGGRTYVPVRFLGESLGAEVDWVSNAQTGLTERVILESDRRFILLDIVDATMLVLNKIDDITRLHELENAPIVRNGRTYLPFRAIMEDGFGAEVGFSTHPDSGLVDAVWVERGR